MKLIKRLNAADILIAIFVLAVVVVLMASTCGYTGVVAEGARAALK